REHRVYLRLRARGRPRALLLVLGGPFGREVAVEVEPFERRRGLDREPVVVLDPSLGQMAVERPVVGAVDGIAADKHARLLRMTLPRAVRVLDTHVEHASVAVDVLNP